MKPQTAMPTRRTSRLPVAFVLLVIATASQLGCGREFFREWANQDVSQVLFEKSRDPRFRLDMFSIDPPAMSRYADPYDPDRPPAPPDDLATQAMSPVPQYSDNRLIVPVEGTGYLTMLEEFQAENESRLETLKQRNISIGKARGGYGDIPGAYGAPGTTAPAATPPPPVPAPPSSNTTSPFKPSTDVKPSQPMAPNTLAPGVRDATPVPSANGGTNPSSLSPNSIPDRALMPKPASPSTPAAVKPSTGPSAARRPAADANVVPTAMQVPAARPGQVVPPGVDPRRVPAEGNDDPSRDPLQTPAVPGDPTPREIQDLSKPVLPRSDLSPRQNEEAEALGSELEGLVGTGIIDFDETQAIGLPSTAKPYIVTMGQALTLALINARVYQFQLENLYATALPVTLQRFAFSPQYIAGLSPSTATIGPLGGGLLPTGAGGTSFTYRTRAAGVQQSGLNIGTVAAVGKNFDNGARILASFASQIVFNFTGKNPMQPTVNSFLPLNVVVPFLKGGGRAVTLEPLTQAERNLVYQIRSFAKFRQEFLITTLVGGSTANFGTGVATPGFTGGGNSDPTTGYINVVEDFVLVENQTRNVQTIAKFAEVYKELIKGESSGVTQLQLDQIDSNLQQARSQLLQVRNNLRNDLDNLKFQIGMPPDTPMTVDRTLTQPFKQVFQEVERWSRDPKRSLDQLDTIAAKLPKLEEIMIDGRNATETFRSGSDDNLEDLLLAAERVSFENRLDLMNTRAQLYDSWRQIKVTANALKGVLNVNMTNQFVTPPTTTNPFGFVSQARQFSLVLNGELPLVRMSERNAFRTALINYQRQRRSLMSAEDFQKNQLRQDVRNLQVSYVQYELTKRNFVLFARQKDQSFENIVAPPAGGGTGTAAGNSQGAVQTNNLLSAQNQLINFENNLVTQWYSYQTQRLILYRDLGTLPYDEWEAFYELYPSQYAGIGVGGDGVAGGATSSPPTAP